MALYVVDKTEGDKVPFLRGILTRSLVKAGLSFDKAYNVADQTRENLSNKGEVTSDELRDLVTVHLEKIGEDEVAARYRFGSNPFHIEVLGRDGVVSPFSRVTLEQSLELCSLNPEKKELFLQSVEEEVRGLGQETIDSSVLARLFHEHLLKFAGKECAHRYLLWLEFTNSGVPLVLLIGGTTGSGKSSIAAELSHRLNIVRTQSTDMLREVMRLMLPQTLLPTLHESSFAAHKAIPSRSADSHPGLSNLEAGYLTQAERVGVAISAVVNRAVTEGVSIIVEGVHVHPEMMDSIASSIDAIVVPLVVAAPKRKNLRKQLKGRGKQLSSRRSQRYMDNFEEIWAMQSFLISEAERFDVNIVPSTDLQDATVLVKDHIAEVLAKHFKADPKVLLSGISNQLATS